MNFWMIFAIIEGVFLFVSLFYVFRFAKIILNIQEVIEKSLDVLDEKYISISKILEKPVFFDSVEVRQVVSDIFECQVTIYNIANAITNIDNLEKINERKEEDSKED